MTSTPKRGFTLIELLAVMSIAALLLAVALGASLSWGRSTGMRSSVVNVKSSLALARQWAITHGTRTLFTYANTPPPQERGYYIITSPSYGNLGNTNYLARGLVFTNIFMNPIEFRSDGICGGTASSWPPSGNSGEIVLYEQNKGANGLSSTITVFRLTGYARIEE